MHNAMALKWEREDDEALQTGVGQRRARDEAVLVRERLFDEIDGALC
jgi:hypothetical protein